MVPDATAESTEPTGVAYALTNADVISAATWEVVSHSSEDIGSNKCVKNCVLAKAIFFS